MGVAALMGAAYAGTDLSPLASQLMERATADPTDANALMDLATIMQLRFAPEIALGLQAQALQIRQHYRLPAADGEAVRVLALKAPGALMANAPLEFLVQDSDITLEILYVSPDLPLPESLPAHDVLFVAVNESDANRPVLERIETLVAASPRTVLNAPHRIGALSRTNVCSLIESAPGRLMPHCLRVDRRSLTELGADAQAFGDLLGPSGYPIIVRPVDSHAGHGLRKLDDPTAIAEYLQTVTGDEFYASDFIDYRSADGLFRKYRVVLIDGHPYPCHMAISTEWMVHYLNAGMIESAAKRAEEARFMERFDEDFALRHHETLRGIAECVDLDYLVIDCAETRTGELLVFELDSGAVVHSMDPVDLFPYKPPHMRKIFSAFRELLIKAKNAK